MAKQIWKPGNMIYPLPAVMVSCQREGEKPNIITVAWTGTVCTNPPMVYMSVRPQSVIRMIFWMRQENLSST